MNNQSSLIKAGTLSIFLHAALLVGLVLASQLKPVKKQPLKVMLTNDKPVVQAAMVNQADVQRQVARLRQEKIDAQRAQQRRDKQIQAEKQRIRQLERQRKKKLAEKRAADKAAKQSKEQASKQHKAAEKAIKQAKLKQQQEAAKAKAMKRERIRQEKAAAKAKAQRIAQEKAAKAKAEKLRQQRLAKEKAARLQKQREDLLAKEMAAEQQALNQARQVKVMSEIQKYTSLISTEIQRHWNTDDSMRGKQCVLNIKLAPNGFVSSVRAVSGDTYVCQSARAAVLKATSLPVSKDAQVYQELKDINLTVQPEFD